MSSTMTVLEIMPGCKPKRVAMAHTLEAMQSKVGGYIQAIYPYEDSIAIVCNEEGKLMGLEPNRAVRDSESKEIIDIVCGTFFICGLGEEDFCSLTEEQITYYEALFHNPEVFLWNGTSIIALPVDI